ncbi:MAG: ribbon-helix-helix domain-containing protein [Herpetosiphonaceae bacterium]|nr:ribbon-helix-helix domain-containing protein [Herpetosiphonaceae bacterium]
MATMIRKQIYLEPAQNAQLKRISQEVGVPEAELIRQAIDMHLRSLHQLKPDPSVWKAERAFIEQLIAMGPVNGGRRWTRDELYDR